MSSRDKLVQNQTANRTDLEMLPLNISMTSVSLAYPRFFSLSCGFQQLHLFIFFLAKLPPLAGEAAAERLGHDLCLECYLAQLWLFSFQASRMSRKY